mgnify:CR=1 FL=1
MKKPFRRDFPSTVKGLQAYNKAKSNWNKKQKSDRQTAIAGKPFRRNFPSTVEGLKNYNAAKAAWVTKKNKNLKDLKNEKKPEVKEKLKINKIDPKQFDNRKNKINKIDPKQFDKRKLKISDEAKQDLKDQNSQAFGGVLPKKKKVVKKETPKKVIKSTTKGGPVKDGVEYARSKGDDLAGFRRGPGTKLGKDTRITKSLKKSGFTEDRLARLRKQHAEFKAKRKKKK